MKDILLHLFLPHESNNHRAKFLHHGSLLLLIAILFITSFFTTFSSQSQGQVLGVSSDISASELLSFTNQKRAEEGLPPFTLNDKLSQAAAQKAQDMFEKNYWAHNAPDGGTPWVFIKSSGYDYLYAGENLARGFYTSDDVVDAWMASPGHRENIISGNYDDVGFAVVDGNLTGDDTILVVQMFGRVKQASPPIAAQEGNTPSESDIGVPVISDLSGDSGAQPASETEVASVQSTPLIDVQIFSKTSSLILLSVLMGLLLFDLVIIKRRQIIRILSHNFDHVIFLSIVFVVILIVGQGVVL